MTFEMRARNGAQSPATESVDVSCRARAEVAALCTCSGRLTCAGKQVDFFCAFADRLWIGLRGLELCIGLG